MLKKKINQNFILISASLLLIIFTLEIFVRLIIDNGMNYDLEMMKYSKTLKLKSRDANVGIEHKKNKEAVLMGQKIILNEYGFRNETPVSNDKKKILMLGDSMTFGWGSKETFSSLLENKFGVNYQVLNAGIGNTNTIMQINNFFINYKEISPEVIVLNFYINDLEKINVKETNFIVKNLYLYTFISSKFYKIRMKFQNKPDWQKFYSKNFKDQFIFEQTKNEISKLDDYCKKNNIKFIIHNIPELRDLKDYQFEKETSLIKEYAIENNITFLDSFENLKNYNEESLWVTFEDSHANDKAHFIIAEYLYENFKSQNLIKLN